MVRTDHRVNHRGQPRLDRGTAANDGPAIAGRRPPTTGAGMVAHRPPRWP